MAAAPVMTTSTRASSLASALTQPATLNAAMEPVTPKTIRFPANEFDMSRLAAGQLAADNLLITAATEKSKQHQKQVDEIEIKRQGTHDRSFGNGLLSLRHDSLFTHPLDFLHVIGGQASKNEHANHRSDPVNAGTLEEDIDDGGNYQADKPHEQKRTPAGQVTLGHQTIDRHGSKHSSGNDKGRGYRGAGISEEDRGEE